MDNELNKVIHSTFLELFNRVAIIDPMGDSVKTYLYDVNLVNDANYTIESYYNHLKKIIHPDYVNDYFALISLNGLKEKNDYAWFKHEKLANGLAYETYIDVIKNINDKIVIMSMKYHLEEAKTIASSLDYDVADFIYNLELAINNVKSKEYETLSAFKYINELIYDLKKKNETVLNKYSDILKLNVNKTYKSLLIVDDDNLTRNIFKKVFEKDYKIIEAKNGSEAIGIINQKILNVDDMATENIVGMFLDLKMPVLDGFGVLDYLNEKNLISRMPVIIISADDAKETREAVYSYAIADMIEKPFNYELISKRVNNLINLYAKSNGVSDLVNSQEKDLKAIINSYTNAYLLNRESLISKIQTYYEILLNEYVTLNGEKINVVNLKDAIKFYDIGLDLVPRSYIQNISTLDAVHKDIVYKYPFQSEKILRYITDLNSEVLKYAANIAVMRSERFDGLGFPKGLKNEEIPEYVYLANIAIEYAGLLINPNVNYLDAYNTIISKVSTKYSENSISIYKSAYAKMQIR